MQDGCVARVLGCLDPARDLEAVNIGKADIEQYEIRIFGLREPERFLTGSGFNDVKAVLAERASERVTLRCIVIDDEDASACVLCDQCAFSIARPYQVFKNNSLAQEDE